MTFIVWVVLVREIEEEIKVGSGEVFFLWLYVGLVVKLIGVGWFGVDGCVIYSKIFEGRRFVGVLIFILERGF